MVEKKKTKKQELEELNEKYVRLYADFDNYKKRVAKEKFEYMDFAKGEIIEKLFPFIDNIDRALETLNEEDSAYKGVMMLKNQFEKVLVDEGVIEIEASGTKFDPNLHHAVLTVSNEELEDDVVTNVMQKGYIYKSKVLRPSMVEVNKI